MDFLAKVRAITFRQVEASSHPEEGQIIVGSCVNSICKYSKSLEAVAPVHVPSSQIFQVNESCRFSMPWGYPILSN